MSTATKQTFKIQTNKTSCNTNNLIYLIECDNCGLQYIGQTKRSLRHRFHNHRFDILNNEKNLSRQPFQSIKIRNFWLLNYPNFQMPHTGIWGINDQETLVIEQYFISLLKTYQPFGLNISKRKYPDSPTVQFVVPYSGLATKSSKVVRNHFSNLQEKLPNVFPEAIITAYKRNENIGDMLVSSKIKPNTRN